MKNLDNADFGQLIELAKMKIEDPKKYKEIMDALTDTVKAIGKGLQEVVGPSVQPLTNCVDDSYFFKKKGE